MKEISAALRWPRAVSRVRGTRMVGVSSVVAKDGSVRVYRVLMSSELALLDRAVLATAPSRRAGVKRRPGAMAQWCCAATACPSGLRKRGTYGGLKKIVGLLPSSKQPKLRLSSN